MGLVIGVDPGLSGALAEYDYETNSMSIRDMPTFNMVINKKNRKRADAVGIAEYFEMRKMMGAELVMLESVGGRPQQSASGGFVFGFTTGLIYMAAVAARIPVETVPANTWKAVMKVQGKAHVAAKGGKKSDAVIHRADELMPDHRNLWRGPQGGADMDRAEAAMLALYGAQYALKSLRGDAQWRIIGEKA